MCYYETSVQGLTAGLVDSRSAISPPSPPNHQPRGCFTESPNGRGGRADSHVHGREAHRPSFAIGGGGLHKRSREGTAMSGLRVPFWAQIVTCTPRTKVKSVELYGSNGTTYSLAAYAAGLSLRWATASRRAFPGGYAPIFPATLG